MSDRVRRFFLVWALSAASAQAARLELPSFLQTARQMHSVDLIGDTVDLWFNPLILMPPTGTPTVQDNANAYVRWGDHTGSFVEVAIWRTVGGRAIVGVNAVKPHVQLCADFPCGPAAAFIGYDGRAYVPPSAATLGLEVGCNGLLPLPSRTDSPALRAALHAAQARLRSYRVALKDRNLASVMCVFPRYGTTVTVAVHTTDLAAARGRIFPLYYFRFDQVRGTFTPSAEP
ncbi:hypothetical protein GO986_17310 [Deinococcus sp. HMF7620]|uniref:Uncharacterized protein n=1 Tax=Deinococcus arboris TaxID=2682977 RepID=A0A7C9M3T9_9DEIO|nr:hypothetical protein [Deinococcus arboris]MVN88502.1 hypothetical protein [Deinococcus arboris]